MSFHYFDKAPGCFMLFVVSIYALTVLLTIKVCWWFWSIEGNETDRANCGGCGDQLKPGYMNNQAHEARGRSNIKVNLWQRVGELITAHVTTFTVGVMVGYLWALFSLFLG